MVRVRVGTYADGGGAGLCTLRHDEVNGWAVGEADPAIRNASFATYSARHRLYYIVDEQADGAVGVYRKTAAGLERVARVATLGAEPCYIALNHQEDMLAAANYGSGSIALFRLDPDGVPFAPPVVRANSGAGPVADRQAEPHAHCVCFGPDDRWLYHVDLGTDQIIAYPVDRATRQLGAPAIAFAAPPGSGPRHLVFHPTLPLALLASELASTLSVLQVDGGTLVVRDTVSTVPDEGARASLCGHLTFDAAGARAYVTNRGQDSVAVFACDAAGGLTLLQHVPSGGRSPRAFVLLEAERQMLLANEEDGSIAAFALDADGRLSPTGAPIALAGAAFPFVMAG